MTTVAIILLVVALGCIAAAVMSIVKFGRTKTARFLFAGVILLLAGAYTGAAARLYGAPLLWRLDPAYPAGSASSLLQPPRGGGAQVIPVSKPDEIAGQTVVTGYEAGQSLIYPGYGGYSILANPALRWTIAAKTAYVENHQAEKDLAAFLASPYAGSSAARQAEEPLFSLRGSDSPATAGPGLLTPALPKDVGSYRFHSGTYFAVNGNPRGGFVGDDSTLVTGPGRAFGTALGYPYRLAAWQPLATVYDLPDAKTTVGLSFAWRFSGPLAAVIHPPGVTYGGGYYQWSSENQNTWCYTFVGKPGFVTSSSWLPAQTGTTLDYGGSVTVIHEGGASAGPYGAGREGWGPDGVFSNKAAVVTFAPTYMSVPGFVDLAAILIIILCMSLYGKLGNPYFKLMAWAYGIQVLSGGNLSLGLDNNLSLLPLVPTHWANALSAWLAVIVPLFLVLQATLAYREEREHRGAGAGRLTSLWPAAKGPRFWVIVIGLPVVYGVLRGLMLSHTANAFSAPGVAIVDTVSQAAGMLGLVLTIGLTYSLVKTYGINLFKYFYIIYWAMASFWFLQTVYALYIHWIAANPANQVYVVSNFINSPAYVTHSVLTTAYSLAVPLFSALAFIDYGESRKENPATVDIKV